MLSLYVLQGYIFYLNPLSFGEKKAYVAPKGKNVKKKGGGVSLINIFLLSLTLTLILFLSRRPKEGVS